MSKCLSYNLKRSLQFFFKLKLISRSDWAFWVQKVDCATEHRLESMAVKLCAAAEVIKREYGSSKKSANAVLFGVVMSNVKCATIEGKSTFATKHFRNSKLSTVLSTESYRNNLRTSTKAHTHTPTHTKSSSYFVF